jgi:hypothetical protein
LLPNSSTGLPTLVLDIDETLLSVRRWVDELIPGDQVWIRTPESFWVKGTVMSVTKIITEEIEPGEIFKSIEFISMESHAEVPFVGDITSNGSVIVDIKSSECTISYNHENNCNIELLCLLDSNDIHRLQYIPFESRPQNYVKPEFVWKHFLIRFRPGLAQFLLTLSQVYEIILWTAAVRAIYSEMMVKVLEHLKNQLHRKYGNFLPKSSACVSQSNLKSDCAGNAIKNLELWKTILFRDNCSKMNNFPLKDLARLGRPLSRVIIVDNLRSSFRGFEYNGLNIRDFWGHSTDRDLWIVCEILLSILCYKDVRYGLNRLVEPPILKLQLGYNNNNIPEQELCHLFVNTLLRKQSNIF